MFHGGISLNLVLQQPLLNFVSCSGLELMFISLILIIRSNLIHLNRFQLLVLLFRNDFFYLYQQNKSPSKVKFREASKCCIWALESAKPVLSLLSNLAHVTFGELLIVFPTTVALLDPWVLSFVFDKAKLFVKIFLKNSNLDDVGILLFAVSSSTNLKMPYIPVPPKLVKKVITNLDSSKEPDPDCVPVVVKRKCEPEHFS